MGYHKHEMYDREEHLRMAHETGECDSCVLESFPVECSCGEGMIHSFSADLAEDDFACDSGGYCSMSEDDNPELHELLMELRGHDSALSPEGTAQNEHFDVLQGADNDVQPAASNSTSDGVKTEKSEDVFQLRFPRTPPVKYSLLENGVDFLVVAIEAVFGFSDYQANRYKYSILHAFSGVLLILKERLRREHESLIFEKVEKVGDSASRTVDFDTVLLRLEKIANVRIDDSSKQLLRKVQSARNRLEHYEVHLEQGDALAMVTRLVEFAYWFLRDELGTNLRDHISPIAWNDVKDLEAIFKRLEAQGEIVNQCPRCGKRLRARRGFCSECTNYLDQDHT